MKKSPLILYVVVSLILLAACVGNNSTQTVSNDEDKIATIVAGTLSVIPSPSLMPTETLILTTPLSTSPSDNWSAYSSPEYGFSIRYPDDLEITPGDNSASFYIGKKIHVWIGDANPLDCQGDCPVIENTEPVIAAGLEATRITGYIGAVGGNNPQQYISIVLSRNGLYYKFTLYALEFDAPLINPPPSTVEPLIESDIILFEQIIETLSFSN